MRVKFVYSEKDTKLKKKFKFDLILVLINVKKNCDPLKIYELYPIRLNF